MTSNHDQYVLDNAEQPISTCPICEGEKVNGDNGKSEPCTECDGFGEIIKSNE